MAFYDTTQPLKGMANATQEMIGASMRRGNAAAKGKALIGDAAKELAGVINSALINEKKVIDDKKRKDALVKALQGSGASKEIVSAAQSLNKSDDILPLVSVLVNPKRISSVSHSYGKVLMQDLLRGTKENIGTSYAGVFGKGGSGSSSTTKTYITAGNPISTMIEKNPEVRNKMLSDGTLNQDANGNFFTTNYAGVENAIANSFKENADARLNSQQPRINEENAKLDKTISGYLELQNELKKKKPLIFGDANDFFK